MNVNTRNHPESRFKNAVQNLHENYSSLITLNNKKDEDNYNGIFHRYEHPVLTAKHIPLMWRYDLNPDTNPFLMERLEVNSVFNAGAYYKNGTFFLIPRIESNDVKSFFGLATSRTGVDNFTFDEYPIVMPQTEDPDMNVYDMRIVEHEDGWIYGLFCTERKDSERPLDSSAAIAKNGMARTKDLKTWERLPDLISKSPQQRNCVLHPEFVNDKYAFYTRPMDGFIETGSGGGIGWATCDDISNPVLKDEIIIDERKYHTIKEVKNGLGPQPLKTKHGWLHLAHGVRRTAAGLRYVLYLFMCDLNEPWKVIKSPQRHFMAPLGSERVGDVSNVVFSNGWIEKEDGTVLIYYASSDTRTHVAKTSKEKLIDYILNTPEDAGRTFDCVQQRIELINKNKAYLKTSNNGL